MAIASNRGRGIRRVHSTVTNAISVSTARSTVKAYAMNRCGMARSHCTSGRQRAICGVPWNSSRVGYGVAKDMVPSLGGLSADDARCP